MMAYALLLALPLGWALASRRGGRAAAAAPWLIALFLLLFVGLRREVGGDWDSYLLMLRRAAALPLADALTLSDPAYMLLGRLAARAGLGIAAVNLACAAIFAFGLARLSRARPLPPLALLVALPVLVAIVAMNATRQAAALGLVMWAMSQWLTGARGRPALLVAAAIAFHWTALVFAPFAALAASRLKLPDRLLLAGAVLSGAAALILLGPAGPAPGSWLRALPTAAALLLWFALPRAGLNAAEARLGAFLAALALATLLLLASLPLAADRIGYYAVPFQMLVVTRAAACLDGRRRLAFVAGTAAFFAALLVGWLALTAYAPCMTPYRSYLADPSAALLGPAEPMRADAACARVQ